VDRIYVWCAFNEGNYLVWVFGPDEGFGFAVVLGEEAVDGGLKIADRAEDAALEPPFGKPCEDPLHGIESDKFLELHQGQYRFIFAGRQVCIQKLQEEHCVFTQAEPLVQRALAIDEKVRGAEQLAVGEDPNALAGLYYVEGRYSEAEPLYKRAIVIAEKSLGPDHHDIANTLNNLAVLYNTQGRHVEAEPLMKHALAIDEIAAGYWRKSTDVITHRPQRGTLAVGEALTGKRKSEAAQLNSRFWGLVKAVSRLAAAAAP
jgi:tetratricopeptide (TPR) repeat protein